MKKVRKVKEQINQVPKTNIQGNVFYGVKWDSYSLEVLKLVAQGLVNLTDVFKAQNVQIGAMLHIDGRDNVKVADSSFTR